MHNALMFSLNSGRMMIQGRTSGAYRIATELRDAGWEVEVIDFFYYWTLDELKQLAKSRINKDTKFIGFSLLWMSWPEHAEEFCKWIKETYPDITIISGSMVYQNLNSSYIDYYFKGFSEVALFKLLDYLFSNGEIPIIRKLNGNNVIFSDQDYPASPWKNPLIIYEDRDFLEPVEMLPIEFSRGCKFACKFCNFPILGVKGDYTRDAEGVEQQLTDAYDRFGITRYTVNDETFNDSTEKITKFADVVEKLNFQPFFTGFLRADLLISRERDREELLRMNLVGHFYGIESFNNESAKFIGKGMDTDRVKAGLIDIKKYFKSHGNNLYKGYCSFIAGLPFETEDDIWKTYEWLKENWSTEGFVMNPLEIEKLNPLSINTASKLSKDYAKHGYRPMSSADEAAYKESSLKTYNMFKTKTHRTTFFRDDIVYWENTHSNIFRMGDIVQQIRDDARTRSFTIGGHNIGTDLSGDSLEQTMKKPADHDFSQGRQAFVESYKYRKLSR